MDLKKTSRKRSKRCIFISIAVAIAVIIAIVIPLAVLIPKRKHHTTASVLLSLYIYPSNSSSWQPLYDA
jgi:hypothetical protein